MFSVIKAIYPLSKSEGTDHDNGTWCISQNGDEIEHTNHAQDPCSETCTALIGYIMRVYSYCSEKALNAQEK